MQTASAVKSHAKQGSPLPSGGLFFILFNMRLGFRHIVILAILAFFGMAQASGTGESLFFKDSVEAEQLALDTLVDYDAHYVNLVQQEEKDISHKQNLIVLSSILISFGTVMPITLYRGLDFDGQETLKETLAMEVCIFSISLAAIGVVGLSYNLYGLFNSEGNYSKRDSYKRAHEIYNQRRSERKGGAKIALAPTFGIVTPSAGMNLLVLF